MNKNDTLELKSSRLWQPQRLPRPTVDPRFSQMNGLERAAESWRYNLLLLELWVSPNGHLREWTRCSTLLGAWLAIPAILVMPIIGLILDQVASWLTELVGIVGHLIVLPMLLLVALLVLSVVKALIFPRR